MQTYHETDGLPPVVVTAVGSMPHTDSTEAVDLILGSLPSAPHAPQLSSRDPREQMWIQFTEGLPRFRADFQELRYQFDTTGDPMEEVETFFAEYLKVVEGGSAEAFAIGPEYGGGIHAFLQALQDADRKWPVIKVQVTGPISFATTVTDEAGKPIFYHPLFKDVAVKGVGLKAAWLVERFQPFADTVVVFFDEPSMSAYGSSAFLGISQTDVIEALDDAIALAVDRGGIPGVHCCGNTDWSLLMESAMRIINFDAVDYMHTMAIYPQQLNAFLERNGVLAWGAVPNTERIRSENRDTIVQRVRDGMQTLKSVGVDVANLEKRLMITPACGCAGMSREDVSLAYKLLAELHEAGARFAA